MTSTTWPVTRRAAAAALASAIVLALSGCVFVTPREELDDPLVSGTTSVDVGSAKLRGLVIISDGSRAGSDGSLVLVALNDSVRDLVLHLTYASASGSRTAALDVPARSFVSRGTRPGQEQVILADLAAAPGGLLTLRVASAGRVARVDVPVLNGSLPYYATLTPSPASTVGGAPSPVPGA